jgi:hypothetical protein
MLDHHTSALVFDAVWDDESFTNLVNAVNKSAVSYNNINRGQLALDSGKISSITTTRDHATEFQTATPRDPFAFPKEAFYSHCLPREIFIFLIITALQYWWHIFLERILPGRPRPQAAQSEKEAEYSEGREEEIVQRWITQGRVQRSSLNWCNTFLKWVVEMTVGRLWYHTIEHGIRLLLEPEDPTLSTIGFKHVSHFFPFFRPICALPNLTRHCSTLRSIISAPGFLLFRLPRLSLLLLFPNTRESCSWLEQIWSHGSLGTRSCASLPLGLSRRSLCRRRCRTLQLAWKMPDT